MPFDRLLVVVHHDTLHDQWQKLFEVRLLAFSISAAYDVYRYTQSYYEFTPTNTYKYHTPFPKHRRSSAVPPGKKPSGNQYKFT